MTVIVIRDHTHILQYMHDIVLVLVDVFAAAETRTAALHQDAGHTVQRRAVVRARRRGRTHHVLHVDQAGKLAGLVVDLFRSVSGKIGIGMQIFLKVAAVQVKIVVSLEDEFAQQEISELIGAA